MLVPPIIPAAERVTLNLVVSLVTPQVPSLWLLYPASLPSTAPTARLIPHYMESSFITADCINLITPAQSNHKRDWKVLCLFGFLNKDPVHEVLIKLVG